MKKIMFSDRHGLTEAVLCGRKTQTRRILRLRSIDEEQLDKAYHGTRWLWNAIGEQAIALFAKFKVGEVVAVAQSYKNAGYDSGALNRSPKDINVVRGTLGQSAGWNNKMFVRADACRHQIRITNIRIEKLQDVSDEDCIKEGIVKWTKDRELFKYDLSEHYEMFAWSEKPKSPYEAYATLIDRISGNGIWHSNPFVLVYDFDLVK